MEKESKIVFINTHNLYPHPDNPRKNIGDVTELAESIKKNGIMQNLTVMPLSALDEIPEKQPDADSMSLLSDFIVLIGHRRLEASRKAGIQEVPCRIISKITRSDQIGIMLEENMQRNDLTFYEEAQSFQTMLDLGETAESISQKTGFSKSTVYHRLNIAKLNQEELQKKEQDSSFQMSLTAIYELEKIEDIKTRNKVLKDATDNQNLVTRARNAVREEKRKQAEKEMVKILDEMGVSKAPSGVSVYDSRYERIKDINLDKELPEKINLKGKGPFVYVESYGMMYILRKKAKEKKVKTKEELQREDREKRKKQLKEIVKEMDKRRRLFVLDLVTGNTLNSKESGELKDRIWQCFMKIGVSCYRSNLAYFYTEKSSFNCTPEEKESAEKWIDSLSVVQQMLVVLSNMVKEVEPYDYYSRYVENKERNKVDAMKLFEEYGWYFTEEEQQLLDGTHELYEKEQSD